MQTRRGLLRTTTLAGAALVGGGMALAAGATRAQETPPPARTFVGLLEGGNAAIAVVLDGRMVLAYVCDGTPGGVATWGWFAGEREGTHLELVATNGAVLFLDLSGETPSGSLLSRMGETLAYTTEAARVPAGLWRAQGQVAGQPVLAAWVVLNDGQQRGAKVQAGVAQPVGFIDPTTDLSRPQVVNVGGGTLQARLVGFIDPTSDI